MTTTSTLNLKNITLTLLALQNYFKTLKTSKVSPVLSLPLKGTDPVEREWETKSENQRGYELCRVKFKRRSSKFVGFGVKEINFTCIKWVFLVFQWSKDPCMLRKIHSDLVKIMRKNIWSRSTLYECYQWSYVSFKLYNTLHSICY